MKLMRRGCGLQFILFSSMDEKVQINCKFSDSVDKSCLSAFIKKLTKMKAFWTWTGLDKTQGFIEKNLQTGFSTSFSGKRGFLKQAFWLKMSLFGVRNATVKYATRSPHEIWSGVIFLWFYVKSRENGKLKFAEVASLVYYVQSFIKLNC